MMQAEHDVVGDDRHHHVELELAGFRRERHRGVEAECLVAHLIHHLGDRRIHLPRHDARPGLHRGQDDLGQPGARPRGEQPDVVGDLVEVEDVRAERPAQRGDVAHRLHELHPVLALPQVEAAHLAQVLHHERRVVRLGVDAGADRRAADVHLPEPVGGLRQLLPVALHGVAVGGELLAQPDGRGVLQVGAAGLDDVVELGALGQQRRGQEVERGERGGQRGQHREPHRGRDHVVGALGHVDVIVGMHRRVLPARLGRGSRWPGWRAPR